MDLQQGDCIHLPGLQLPAFHLPDEASAAPQPASNPGAADRVIAGQAPEEQLYQVVSVDATGDRCWLRRWPLARHGSPVFELSLHQLQSRQPHRPHLRHPG